MKQQVTEKEKYFWNTMGGFANALASIVMSVAVNRILGGNYGGIFALAYANAQLMLTVGQFEVRQFQVTDVRPQYSFKTYHRLRVLTCLIMLVVTCGYLFLNAGVFSGQETGIVLYLAVFKMVEAYADVYAGLFQKKDRIDISGKLFFIRVTLSTLVFIAALILFKSLTVASALLPVVSFLLLFLFDLRYAAQITQDTEEGKGSVGQLIRDVFPLFLQAFCMVYLNNSPRYAIARFYAPEVQNIYNILFMPSFTINLFCVFIYLPMSLKIANNWNAGAWAEFRRSLITVIALLLIFTAVVLVGTWLLGIPILSLLYHVDLTGHTGNLLLVMAAGGISAFSIFMYNVITAMRYHKWLICGYGVVAILSWWISSPLVKSAGIRGGILTYVISVTVLAVAYLMIFICGYRNKKSGKTVR